MAHLNENLADLLKSLQPVQVYKELIDNPKHSGKQYDFT